MVIMQHHGKIGKFWAPQNDFAINQSWSTVPYNVTFWALTIFLEEFLYLKWIKDLFLHADWLSSILTLLYFFRTDHHIIVILFCFEMLLYHLITLGWFLIGWGFSFILYRKKVWDLVVVGSCFGTGNSCKRTCHTCCYIWNWSWYVFYAFCFYFIFHSIILVIDFLFFPEIMKFYVKKWCRISSEIGIRSIVDWSYYKQRLCSAIQKIVTIPAAMQKVNHLLFCITMLAFLLNFCWQLAIQVSNPVPRVIHPDWLHKKVREKEDKFRQRKLVDIFSFKSRSDGGIDMGPDTCNIRQTADDQNVEDMEDIRTTGKTPRGGPRPIVRYYDANNGQHSSKTNHQIECLQPESGSGGGGVCKLPKSLPENDTSKENIDRNVDYEGWLELKKRKWKQTREKRKRQRYSVFLQIYIFTLVLLELSLQRYMLYDNGTFSLFCKWIYNYAIFST